MPRQTTLLIPANPLPLLVACALVAAAPLEAAAEPAPTIQVESALLRVVEKASIPARAAGVLDEVRVTEGDLVTEEELLAKVDAEQATLVLQRAAIEHELAKRRASQDIAVRSAQKSIEFTRKEHLRMQRAASALPGSVSKSEVEESLVNAQQAELELEKAQHEGEQDSLTARLKKAEQMVAASTLKSHEIKSPIAGMVVEVLRRRGEWVEPGDEVIKLMRIDRLRAEGLIRVEDALGNLKGAVAEISVAGPGGASETVRGKVVFVHPEVNPVNARVRVRAEFNNPGGRWMPGMRATMVILPKADAPRATGGVAASGNAGS